MKFLVAFKLFFVVVVLFHFLACAHAFNIKNDEYSLQVQFLLHLNFPGRFFLSLTMHTIHNIEFFVFSFLHQRTDPFYFEIKSVHHIHLIYRQWRRKFNHSQNLLRTVQEKNYIFFLDNYAREKNECIHINFERLYKCY